MVDNESSQRFLCWSVLQKSDLFTSTLQTAVHQHSIALRLWPHSCDKGAGPSASEGRLPLGAGASVLRCDHRGGPSEPSVGPRQGVAPATHGSSIRVRLCCAGYGRGGAHRGMVHAISKRRACRNETVLNWLMGLMAHFKWRSDRWSDCGMFRKDVVIMKVMWQAWKRAWFVLWWPLSGRNRFWAGECWTSLLTSRSRVSNLRIAQLVLVTNWCQHPWSGALDGGAACIVSGLFHAASHCLVAMFD